MDIGLLDAAAAARPADLAIRGGQLVNVFTGEIYPADVAVAGDRIVAVGDVGGYLGRDTEIVDAAGGYLVPGLIDGHIHLECSKLSVTMFATAVVPRGTTAVVSGLDQIFVVAGLAGVREFLDEARQAPLSLFWAAPARMPYTFPESTVGFTFGPEQHRQAQAWPECVGVWETVQEFITERDSRVLAALDLAARNRLPVLGCAPMARGQRLAILLCAGVRADHECYSAAETLEKLRSGMHVLLRESSVAHFLDENIKAITQGGAAADRVGFCTDDVTASDVLAHGHLDRLVRMAIGHGIEPVRAIQMATINCAQIYRIDDRVGSISPGRLASMLIVDDPASFTVERVIAKGRLVAENGRMITQPEPPPRSPGLLKSFRARQFQPADFQVRVDQATGAVRVLAMQMSPDVPFVRKGREVTMAVRDRVVPPDTGQDVLYVTVVERFGKTAHHPVAFISGFGLREGALASSASPDDNNILCVGASPADIALAVNRVARAGGGQVVVRGGEVLAWLPLPVGGIVADLPPPQMAGAEAELDRAARQLGCSLPSPFMYLIFLSVTAIPEYAMTDLGLIDCVNLRVVSPVLGPEPGPPPAQPGGKGKRHERDHVVHRGNAQG
jgi:adenine deaminase